MKLGMKMVNRTIVKLAKLQALIFCTKKVISEKPLRGAESAPPPILNRVKVIMLLININMYLCHISVYNIKY